MNPPYVPLPHTIVPSIESTCCFGAMPRVPVEGRDFTKLLDEKDDIWWCCGSFGCYENFTRADDFSLHAISKHGWDRIPPTEADRFKELGDPDWMDLNVGPQTSKYLSLEYLRLSGTKVHRWKMVRRLLWRQSMCSEQRKVAAKYGEEPIHGQDSLLVPVLKVVLIHDDMDPWKCLANEDHVEYVLNMIDNSRDSLDWRNWVLFLDSALSRDYVFSATQVWPDPYLEEVEARSQWTIVRHAIDICMKVFQDGLEDELAFLMRPAKDTFILNAKSFIEVESKHAVWAQKTDKTEYMKRANALYHGLKVERRDEILEKICDSIVSRAQENHGDTFFEAVDRGRLNEVVEDSSDEEIDRNRYRLSMRGRFVHHPVCPNAPAKRGIGLAKKGEKGKAHDKRVAPTTPSMLASPYFAGSSIDSPSTGMVLHGTPTYKKTKAKTSRQPPKPSHFGGFNVGSSSSKEAVAVTKLNDLGKAIATNTYPIAADSEDLDSGTDGEGCLNFSANKFAPFRDRKRNYSEKETPKIASKPSRATLRSSPCVSSVLPLASRSAPLAVHQNNRHFAGASIPCLAVDHSQANQHGLLANTANLEIPDVLPPHPPSMDLVSLSHSDVF